MSTTIDLYIIQQFYNLHNSVCRPISLLPTFSKILENFNTRLSAFDDKHKVISPNQYGFHENMSTFFALTELVKEISASLDNTVHIVGVSIDLNCFIKNGCIWYQRCGT